MTVYEKHSAKEVLDMLKQIDDGKLTVTPIDDPHYIYAGNVEYVCSNGWRFVVFNDCNDFDYIDSVIAPNGDAIELWDLGEEDNGDVRQPPFGWEEVKRYRGVGYDRPDPWGINSYGQTPGKG